MSPFIRIWLTGHTRQTSRIDSEIKQVGSADRRRRAGRRADSGSARAAARDLSARVADYPFATRTLDGELSDVFSLEPPASGFAAGREPRGRGFLPLDRSRSRSSRSRTRTRSIPMERQLLHMPKLVCAFPASRGDAPINALHHAQVIRSAKRGSTATWRARLGSDSGSRLRFAPKLDRFRSIRQSEQTTVTSGCLPGKIRRTNRLRCKPHGMGGRAPGDWPQNRTSLAARRRSAIRVRRARAEDLREPPLRSDRGS
jgi:hypothetical protein